MQPPRPSAAKHRTSTEKPVEIRTLTKEPPEYEENPKPDGRRRSRPGGRHRTRHPADHAGLARARPTRGGRPVARHSAERGAHPRSRHRPDRRRRPNEAPRRPPTAAPDSTYGDRTAKPFPAPPPIAEAEGLRTNNTTQLKTGNPPPASRTPAPRTDTPEPIRDAPPTRRRIKPAEHSRGETQWPTENRRPRTQPRRPTSTA